MPVIERRSRTNHAWQAGGAGLNLQSANVAMLLDPWWNPARLRQAQDRIWRIGSTHSKVFVYSWFTKGTMDEQARRPFSSPPLHPTRMHTTNANPHCTSPDLRRGLVTLLIGLRRFHRAFPPRCLQVLAICDKKENVYWASIRRVENLPPEGDVALGRDLQLINDLREAGFKGRPEQDFTDPKPHQKVGIRWLQRQEAGNNPCARGVNGGIMADDMGLGKTFQTLSLIALDALAQRKAGAVVKPTLVACPKAVFNSWVSDASLFDALRVHVWHGDVSATVCRGTNAKGGPCSKKTKDASGYCDTHRGQATAGPPRMSTGNISAKEIEDMAAAGAVVVLTNEAQLKSAYSKDGKATGVLAKVAWRRLVLDESQRINGQKNDFAAACKLNAEFKWSLSGSMLLHSSNPAISSTRLSNWACHHCRHCPAFTSTGREQPEGF